MPEAAASPPGLETAHSGIFKAEAPDFKPGANEYTLPGGTEPIKPGSSDFKPWSPPVEDVAEKATLQYMYNQLLFQYNTEVSFLRHQVMELTSKLAELDKWKQQTMGLVRDLRDQHRALRRKIGDEPAYSAAVDQKLFGAVSEAEQVLARAKTSPPSSPPPQPPSDLSTSKSDPANNAPQEFDADTGLKVYNTKMNGVDAMRCDWKVSHFSTKLRGAMGRPVVSAPFDLYGCEEVRLMITPEVQESNAGPRTRKEKEQFSKMVTEGPMNACLTLKVPFNSDPVLLKYYLHVGDRTTGPFECDFSNTAIDHRGSFKDASGQGINWLLEMKDTSITVGVEMLPPPSVEDVAVDVEMLKDEKTLPDGNPGAPPGFENAEPLTEAIPDTSGV